MASETALLTLSPIERRTLGTQVYLDLRQLIMSGQLAPGDRLSLRTLAKTLAVSVMPVRDAVSRLVAEQALVVTPNRAVHVPAIKPADLQELALIRAAIEGFAAEQAALRRSDADVRHIATAERIYREECLVPQPDPLRAIPLNMKFHFAIYRAAGMPKLVEIIESLWLRAGPIIILETRNNPERLANGRAIHCHAAALAAIKRGDGAAARQAIGDDIRAATQYILTKINLSAGEK